MIHEPWIDPRDVDWTDALNPLRNPGWAKHVNRYVYNALNDQFLFALRNAAGIEPRIYAGPDQQTSHIPAGSTVDYEVPVEPNCWLWAFSASSDIGDFGEQDFSFNVIDSATGSQLFSQPVSMAVMNAQRTDAARGPLIYLSTPHLYDPPSYPVIRIINTDPNPQICRVNLFTCVEYDL